MKIRTVRPHPSRPHHATGEVVLATFGNYIENRDAVPKMRPVVIVSAGECQHLAAGLTTQSVYKTTGVARPAMPYRPDCGMYGASYLWSQRPTWVCRIDVRFHVGWIGRDVLDVIERNMRLPWHVLAELRAAVAAMTNTDGMVPAEALR